MSPEPMASLRPPTLVILPTDGSTAAATFSTDCCSVVVSEEMETLGAEVAPMVIPPDEFAPAWDAPMPTPASTPTPSVSSSATMARMAKRPRRGGRGGAKGGIPSPKGGDGGMAAYWGSCKSENGAVAADGVDDVYGV